LEHIDYLLWHPTPPPPPPPPSIRLFTHLKNLFMPGIDSSRQGFDFK